MQYDFLKAFPRRMKSVGLYALLFANSGQKAIWKQYGFETIDEQLNMVFSVLLYIMEQSLKEENCTIDEITAFIDDINGQYYRKSMSFDDCHALGYFIVNVVLSNEGRTMHFDGYDYDTLSYQSIHISYVANRIVYLNQEVRRTSYYLTDDGYNLLLGTLEIESNMKLTVQEMIFKLHLEKQSYDKALDDIKNVFNLMRIQLQKIQEAMVRIRRNALDYNVADYSKLLQEDLDTIDQTSEKFRGYRETVQARVKELEETHIDVHTLDKDDEDKLRNLREIELYLNRAIDEYQSILSSHFDLKSLYTSELEKITEMSLVQRFSFRTEVFDRILEDPKRLDRIDFFLRPLFNQDPGKVFNLNKILEAQRIRTDESEDGTDETEDFDEESWRAEQERLRKEKLEKYKTCLSTLLTDAADQEMITLSTISKQLENAGGFVSLIPTVDIFKEVMVELIKVRTIDVNALRKEKSSFIQEKTGTFQLNDMILTILDENPQWHRVKEIRVARIADTAPVVFRQVPADDGSFRNIRCSDVEIRIVGE